MDLPSNASSQSPPCHILRVPNELLHKILNEVVDPLCEDEELWAFFDLRHVCQRFRRIMNQLAVDLVRRWNCDLVGLCPVSEFEPNNRVEFIQLLLADEQLRRDFEAKQHWTFGSYNSFETVFEIIPSVKDSIQSVRLDIGGYDDDEWVSPEDSAFKLIDVLVSLSACRNLKRLKLEGISTRMHLNQISILFPHLKELEMSTRHGSPAIFYGSLSKCSSVETYKLFMWLDKYHSFDGTMHKFFPIESSSTLTSISIILDADSKRPPHCAYQDGRCICTLLRSFECLKELEYLPSCACLPQYMETTRATLTRFVTNLWDASLTYRIDTPNRHEIQNMFSSPALRTLQTLYIYASNSRPFEDEVLIDGITENLLLESLDIRNVSLDLSWAPKFRHLAQLRRIKWRAYDAQDPKGGYEVVSWAGLFWNSTVPELGECFKRRLKDAGGKQSDELRVEISGPRRLLTDGLERNCNLAVNTTD